MRDLPTGPALLALARDVLMNDLLPLLPPDARLDARLVANSMAIAEREAAAGEEAAQEVLRHLQRLYPDAALTHPALRAGSPHTPNSGEGGERSEAGEGQPDGLRRLAADLRAGAFENTADDERRARDILWRLTIAKLRQANPRFLVANGFR